MKQGNAVSTSAWSNDLTNGFYSSFVNHVPIGSIRNETVRMEKFSNFDILPINRPIEGFFRFLIHQNFSNDCDFCEVTAMLLTSLSWPLYDGLSFKFLSSEWLCVRLFYYFVDSFNVKIKDTYCLQYVTYTYSMWHTVSNIRHHYRGSLIRIRWIEK